MSKCECYNRCRKIKSRPLALFDFAQQSIVACAVCRNLRTLGSPPGTSLREFDPNLDMALEQSAKKRRLQREGEVLLRLSDNVTSLHACP